MEDEHHWHEDDIPSTESAEPPAPPPPPEINYPLHQLAELQRCLNTARTTFVPVRVHFAINKSDPGRLRQLVEAGVDLNYVVYANTPLTLAILKEEHAMAHMLVDGGADVRLAEKMAWQRQPLHLAARDGLLDLIVKMVARGADVNATDASLMTALHWAATCGQLPVAEWLVREGAADWEAVDDAGRSPLFRAVEGAHLDIVRLLIDAGAEVDVVDKFGWTPLFMAVVCNDHDTVVELLRAGASVSHQNSAGQTVLHMVADRLANDNLLTLCRTDTDFYIRDRQVSCKASKRAINNPGYELLIAELLIENGADVNVLDQRGVSPLLVAARDGNVDLVRLFVRAGANLLQELWVERADWPVKMAACTETCLWLEGRLKLGLRLQCLCRAAIRKALGRGIDAKLKQLALPSKLLDFLVL